MRQQIFKARKYKGTELLHSQREEVHKNKLVFDITYYPIFSKLKNILSKIHLLLTPDREHSKVSFKQESFHAHFTEGLYQGEGDWEVRLIDQGVSVDDVRWRESYWQHELDTFQPNGLNEPEVALF